MSIHPTTTDHVAVQVVLRRTMHGDATAEAKGVDVQFPQRAGVETPLCGVIVKHAEGRGKEHVATTTHELEVSIVAVANAICVMDRAFRRRAEVCLKALRLRRGSLRKKNRLRTTP